MNGVVRDLLRGPLSIGGRWPLCLRARVCDLRPRFLLKARLGRGYRAIARNGRILLASNLPLDGLAGRCTCVRLQTWHRSILPGDVPEPYGILLCLRCTEDRQDAPHYEAVLARPETHGALCLDVGGGLALIFRQYSHEQVICHSFES